MIIFCNCQTLKISDLTFNGFGVHWSLKECLGWGGRQGLNWNNSEIHGDLTSRWGDSQQNLIFLCTHYQSPVPNLKLPSTTGILTAWQEAKQLYWCEDKDTVRVMGDWDIEGTLIESFQQIITGFSPLLIWTLSSVEQLCLEHFP